MQRPQTILKIIISTVDGGEIAVLIYVDYSEAFDTVHLEKLLAKLDCMHVKDTANEPIKLFRTEKISNT